MEESSSVAEGDQRDESMEQEVTIRERGMDQTSTCQETESEACGLDGRESKPPLNKSDILKAMEVVERDCLAIADSFSSLFASLRLAFSEVTSSPVDHMRCFADAAGRLQESALDAATRGNQYINSCLRLNEEMKGIDNLATQLSFSPIKVELAILSAAEKPLLLKNSEEYRCPRHGRKQARTTPMTLEDELLKLGNQFM